ncbi:MAG TPA: HyaD/HybD family hydrogenase maturation endopeptidase [Candidatus Omnitrophota bacterium]|nr:HyaD/HybD family hydrogenase maturation endopeptidase [Candidatus Omnitrophota bacterium]
MKRIIGCGNLLFRDEGIGVHLIRYLQKEKLPADVELVDGATGGFDLLSFIEGSDRVVIVDAVQADGVPGDIYKFAPEDFEVEAFPQTSLHDVCLKDIFNIVKLTGAMPQVTVFGVEPKIVDWGMELTDEVRAALPRLGQLVLEEIQHA